MQRIQRLLGFVGIKIIRTWVRLLGKTIYKDQASWLVGPIGPDGEIADKPYEILAKEANLTIENDPEGALVKDFGALRGPEFDLDACDPKVRHFYENTAQYKLDVWSETRFPGRFFLWLLVSTVSRYMNQLNFPVFGLEMSKGMTSEILSLKNKEGATVHTGWYRRLKESNRVIYTGFYSHVQPPGHHSNCVKVVFPLPKGNATVILKPGIDQGNQFNLISSGKTFGDPGFYRIVAIDEQRYKVCYLKSLKEKFKVYTDQEGVLRCNHSVHFMGMLILRLHYRMHQKATIDKGERGVGGDDLLQRS